MIRPKGKAEFPPSHQVAHVEVETLAHDFEGNLPSLAEGGEVPECVVHLDMVVDEPDEVRLFRMKQGELFCHRFPRADLASAVELLDIPPGCRLELFHDRLAHLRLSDRTVEVRQD